MEDGKRFKTAESVYKNVDITQREKKVKSIGFSIESLFFYFIYTSSTKKPRLPI